MKVILKHPFFGFSIYQEFSAIPRKGDYFTHTIEYENEIIQIVCDKLNIKKSYQLNNVLFQYPLIFAGVNWVYDEETESYIPEIGLEYMEENEERVNKACQFIDRVRQQQHKKS